MRRHLLLVRHAKSAWDDAALTDHDRPLAPRGLKAVRRLSEYLARAEQRPELVLCSSSRRTVDTLDGIRTALSTDVRVEIDEELYEADSETLLERLRDLDSEIGSAMLIGHNPGTQDLAMRLAGAGDVGMLAQVATKFPTGAAVTLSFDGAWHELAGGAAHLDDFFMPRPPRS